LIRVAAFAAADISVAVPRYYATLLPATMPR